MVEYANLEIEQNNISRARTLLEKARMNIPNNEELWYHSFILEKRTHNQEAIYYMIAKALQNMPNVIFFIILVRRIVVVGCGKRAKKDQESQDC